MTHTTGSSQSYLADTRNEDVIVYVDGEFKPKHQATVSIFDSGFVLGDGVWEGIRLVDGRLIVLDEHLERLYQGAASISLDIGVTRDELVSLIRETLDRNAMHDGVHIRLMVSRGLKSTPNQDPRFLRGKATIVIVAEHKVVDKAAKSQGLALFTSTFRCSSPDVFDLRLNSHSRLNLIQALIQAINAGANEALMLDPHGFVASCNSTNFFIVRNGELWTSTGRYNFNGITHKTVMRLAREADIVVRELDFTLAQTYTADEAFVTGTLGGLTPVYRIDGHAIVNRRDTSLMQRLTALYEDYLKG
ncbi:MULTISPECIES: aminotransferase class IV [unclassified Modicisalibacter]|uniref:aminotransferase class IV n=1 Tax=unclassified Modicisalibacter TaxID=2679913 RepID=UPI001CCD137F|nr:MULTISPECIES: aminotransferase class IV [unclassified Modicisalibacter]MBZ9559802.1 aminotransferase class IV [Modicisalibacter sp. R2A 31.J]MBZ9577254.1 aminotransferase class IV [Modicisalibacter sp. MOD 31.J]